MKEFHRKSIRLPDYDYSQPGIYFITLVTKNREPVFGEIENGIFIPNQLGVIISSSWQKLSLNFPIQLDEFIVMPDHFHGIIIIMDSKGEASGNKLTNHKEVFNPDASPLPYSNHPFGTKSGSLGAIVQTFKSITTRMINAYQKKKGGIIWQRNYYEHIIRNEDDLRLTREYIHNNPIQWEIEKRSRIVYPINQP